MFSWLKRILSFKILLFLLRLLRLDSITIWWYFISNYGIWKRRARTRIRVKRCIVMNLWFGIRTAIFNEIMVKLSPIWNLKCCSCCRWSLQGSSYFTTAIFSVIWILNYWFSRCLKEVRRLVTWSTCRRHRLIMCYIAIFCER